MCEVSSDGGGAKACSVELAERQSGRADKGAVQEGSIQLLRFRIKFGMTVLVKFGMTV